MCQPSTAGPTGGLPSLFAGDTPPVYTAPANAILAVGPCLSMLLRDVHMKTDQAHTIPFFRWPCTVLQNVFSVFFACFEVGGVSPCVGMCVRTCVCVSVSVRFRVSYYV